MKYLAVVGSFIISLILAPLAVAQQDTYRPPLGDIMGKIQLRHIKLWFAGKLANWELATYELDEIRASLEKAADLYRGIPVELVLNTADPIVAITKAIEAKDSAMFAKAYGDLTVACNACHAGIGRGFIVMQVPSVSPFSDQSFAPHPAPLWQRQALTKPRIFTHHAAHLGMSVAVKIEGESWSICRFRDPCANVSAKDWTRWR
jgi:hypothetical protein